MPPTRSVPLPFRKPSYINIIYVIYRRNILACQIRKKSHNKVMIIIMRKNGGGKLNSFDAYSMTGMLILRNDVY